MPQTLILQERTIHSYSAVGATVLRRRQRISLTTVLFVWEKSHVLCKRTVGVRKIVNDGLSKTRVGPPRYWTVWMDEPILS